jgi:hypothetical protein
MDLSGCLVWWVGAALALVHPVPPALVPDGGGVAAPGGPAAAQSVLHRWDAARAAAWASGDVAALRGLYTSGSAAGRADARLLRRYVDRGLRVRGLHTQVFSVRVLQRAPRRVVVRVVDRIVGGVAVGDGQCVPLPHDRADRRTVTLRRVGESWLVADVS